MHSIFVEILFFEDIEAEINQTLTTKAQAERQLRHFYFDNYCYLNKQYTPYSQMADTRGKDWHYASKRGVLG